MSRASVPRHVVRWSLVLVAAASLASCADTGPPAGDSEPNESAAIDALSGEDDGTTQGSWRSAGSAESPLIAFGTPDGEILFSIGCDLRGGLLFQRHGFVARANLGQMQLRTGGNVRRLASTTSSEGQPQVQSRAPYNDALIPALMRFEDPLEVRIEGLETLTLPPSAAVREHAKSCQRGSGPATPVPSTESE